MTCQHIRTSKVSYAGCVAVTCLGCGLKYREWPIAMDPEEYDSCLLMLAAYHLGRGRPDDRTPP